MRKSSRLVRLTVLLGFIAETRSAAYAQAGTKSGASTTFPNWDAGLYTALPLVLWLAFIVLFMVLFHEQIGKVLLAVERRLYLGASFKVGSLELGALASTYVKPGANPSSIAMKTLEPRKDTGKVYEAQHEEVYKSNRRLFVVHRIVPSKEAGQLYDVILYVVAHKSSLMHLEKVEYFLGESWRNYVFTSRDRTRGFPFTTSAWGTFLCTATLFFNDGTSQAVHRFVDFEMGAVGPDESIEHLESDKTSNGKSLKREAGGGKAEEAAKAEEAGNAEGGSSAWLISKAAELPPLDARGLNIAIAAYRGRRNIHVTSRHFGAFS